MDEKPGCEINVILLHWLHRSHRISRSCFPINGVFDFKASTSWQIPLYVCRPYAGIMRLCHRLQLTSGLWCRWKLQSLLEVMLQVIRGRSLDPPPRVNGGVWMTIIATLRNKLAESCFAAWNSYKQYPRSVELWVCFIIRAINKRARRQMARLPLTQAALPETAAKWIPAQKHGSPPNVSRSTKLERRHKTEVTLIDYLELICIFRVIMGVGNRTNRHKRLRRLLMMFLIILSSPEEDEKISKGLSSQV